MRSETTSFFSSWLFDSVSYLGVKIGRLSKGSGLIYLFFLKYFLISIKTIMLFCGTQMIFPFLKV